VVQGVDYEKMKIKARYTIKSYVLFALFNFILIAYAYVETKPKETMRTLALLSTLSLLVCLVAAQGVIYGPAGYTYPDRFDSCKYSIVTADHRPDCFTKRYESIAKFSTADYTTNFEPIYGVAYIYTDYVDNIQRVDELWNITSIENTPFYERFAANYDRHINFENYGYYYYQNSTGAGCALIPFGSLLAQNTFGDPNSFVGNITGHNNKILSVYNTTLSFGDLETYAALYVDADTNLPDRLHIYGTKGIIGDSDLKYINFQAIDDPFSSDLFDVPEVCPGDLSTVGESPRPMRFF